VLGAIDIVGSQLDYHQFGELIEKTINKHMLHHWYKSLDEGQSVRVLFVDYAKAFDSVDHKVMLHRS